MEYKHYLNIFNSQSDYESQKDEVMDMPHVVLLEDTNEVIFASKNKEHDYTSQPFTLVALEDGTMDIAIPSGTTFMNYSLNDGNWVENTEDIVLEVKANDKVKLKANAKAVIGNSYKIFDLSMPFNAEGNIMSLLYGDDFKDKKTIENKHCFNSTFYNTNIISAKNLILPATTLAENCYIYMFYDCTSLTEAPELPATTTLPHECYYGMFQGCTSLTKAPELPATTLSGSCYSHMFYGCTSLTEAPQLPATTLASYCYSYMFEGCRSLTEAPELPATTLKYECYSNMFEGCRSLTKAPELPATTLESYCYYGMFQGCTSLTKAPELLATKLEYRCYERMFYGCSKLNYIKMLARDITSSSYLSNWVDGVASSGTFVKNPIITSWNSSVIPQGWTVKNA